MSKTAADIAVYVGPTAVGVEKLTDALESSRVTLLPPIRRGDLCNLCEDINIVLIADGYFGTQPSVGHLELLNALRSRRIFGCSSLGAIRAYEMRHDGMIGMGYVYDSFFQHADFMDDEVALLHAPEPFYWPLSVPLINVRVALKELESIDACESAQSGLIVGELKRLYFGDRTIEKISSVAITHVNREVAHSLVTTLSTCDIKQRDFIETLEHILSIPEPVESPTLGVRSGV